uniref:Uncharacterized protein n=1 Tax=Avena sativa TaxID=4498 RepID=A0ACD5WU52_AVESA
MTAYCILFKQYMKIQEKIDVAEDSYEFEGDDKTFKVWGDFPMEAQMLRTYTLPIFRKFQLEMRKITSYNVRLIADDTYEVSPIVGSVFGYGKRNYIVLVDLPQQLYKCECYKINRDSLLCCHAMKVMAYVGAVHIMPEHYILPRWCLPPPDVEMPQEQKHPKPEPTEKKLSRKDMRLLRYGNLTNYFAKLAVGAVASEKTNEVAEKHLRALEAELAEMKKATADALKKRKRQSKLLWTRLMIQVELLIMWKHQLEKNHLLLVAQTRCLKIHHYLLQRVGLLIKERRVAFI